MHTASCAAGFETHPTSRRLLTSRRIFTRGIWSCRACSSAPKQPCAIRRPRHMPNVRLLQLRALQSSLGWSRSTPSSHDVVLLRSRNCGSACRLRRRRSSMQRCIFCTLLMPPHDPTRRQRCSKLILPQVVVLLLQVEGTLRAQLAQVTADLRAAQDDGAGRCAATYVSRPPALVASHSAAPRMTMHILISAASKLVSKHWLRGRLSARD